MSPDVSFFSFFFPLLFFWLGKIGSSCSHFVVSLLSTTREDTEAGQTNQIPTANRSISLLPFFPACSWTNTLSLPFPAPVWLLDPLLCLLDSLTWQKSSYFFMGYIFWWVSELYVKRVPYPPKRSGKKGIESVTDRFSLGSCDPFACLIMDCQFFPFICSTSLSSYHSYHINIIVSIQYERILAPTFGMTIRGLITKPWIPADEQPSTTPSSTDNFNFFNFSRASVQLSVRFHSETCEANSRLLSYKLFLMVWIITLFHL